MSGTSNHQGTPQTVRDIEGGEFHGSRGLRPITLPESVRQIGHHAFDGCRTTTPQAVRSTADSGSSKQSPRPKP